MSAALHGATPEQLIRRWYACVASYVEKVRQAFPDFHNHIEDTITQGDKAFARLRQTGTHRGAIVGLAPIGVPVEYAGAAVFTCRDHRIQDVWVPGDVHGLTRQLRAAR